jgi:hypothetical protein
VLVRGHCRRHDAWRRGDDPRLKPAGRPSLTDALLGWRAPRGGGSWRRGANVSPLDEDAPQPDGMDIGGDLGPLRRAEGRGGHRQ